MIYSKSGRGATVELCCAVAAHPTQPGGAVELCCAVAAHPTQPGGARRPSASSYDFGRPRPACWKNAALYADLAHQRHLERLCNVLHADLLPLE